MDNIGNATENFNLPELLVEIRAALEAVDKTLEAVDKAESSALEHAIAAGKYLRQAHEQVGRGFENWLKNNGLQKSTCYQYMQLFDQSVHGHGRFASISEALRALRADTARPSKPKKKALSAADFHKAGLEERRAFLDAIGVEELCGSMSFTLRAKLQSRLPQFRAKASTLGGTIAKAIQQALSLQKCSDRKGEAARGVANCLNVINAKLEAEGLSLNNVDVVIDRSATICKAA
jgi:hypothetical protein